MINDDKDIYTYLYMYNLYICNNYIFILSNSAG